MPCKTKQTDRRKKMCIFIKSMAVRRFDSVKLVLKTQIHRRRRLQRLKNGWVHVTHIHIKYFDTMYVDTNEQQCYACIGSVYVCLHRPDSIKKWCSFTSELGMRWCLCIDFHIIFASHLKRRLSKLRPLDSIYLTQPKNFSNWSDYVESCMQCITLSSLSSALEHSKHDKKPSYCKILTT